MPALTHRTARSRQNSEGRRRTSLEGGNRGIAVTSQDQTTVYGDLNGGSGLNLTNKPIGWTMT